MTDTSPTVTDVRTALIREASAAIERRQACYRALHAIPAEQRENNPRYNALFDTYEDLAREGSYAQTIAAILRTVEQRHPETAADLAALVHEVMENGDDVLDGPNDDIWALIERETEAKTAATPAPACSAEVSDHTCTCLTAAPGEA